MKMNEIGFEATVPIYQPSTQINAHTHVNVRHILIPPKSVFAT